MIEIIEHGTKQVTKCKVCGCKFSYEAEDIISNTIRSRSYVTCPQCKEEIVLKAKRGFSNDPLSE